MQTHGGGKREQVVLDKERDGERGRGSAQKRKGCGARRQTGQELPRAALRFARVPKKRKGSGGSRIETQAGKAPSQAEELRVVHADAIWYEDSHSQHKQERGEDAKAPVNAMAMPASSHDFML